MTDSLDTQICQSARHGTFTIKVHGKEHDCKLMVSQADNSFTLSIE